MKHFFFAALSFLIVVTVTQTACFYDNEEDLYGSATCDTTAVSYISDIRPIVDAHCVSCHAPGGEQESSPLVTYDDLKNYAGDQNLIERTNGTGSLMPPTGKMNACNISLIAAWVNAGAPNN